MPDLRTLYQSSPAWALLRARTAPEILEFLHQTFKTEQSPAQDYFQTSLALADYIQFQQPDLVQENELEHETGEEDAKRAGRLLDKWVKAGWLRKYPDDRGIDWLELTPDTEKAMIFVQGLQTREFVGTESRFKDIFRKLAEMVEGSEEDPTNKIKELESQIKAAQAQIKEIRKTGKVETLSNTQLKERLYELGKGMRELLSDFKEVEHNFKAITRQIYEQQGDQNLSKGGLLGYALDRLDDLRDNDQGRSFYAFWEFLISSDRQQRLKSLTKEVVHLMEDRAIPVQDPIFQGFRRQLHGSGQKVFDSNQRLADKLNRIIAEQNLRERKRALRTMDEIRKLALENGPPEQGRKKFWFVEAEAKIDLPMDRPLGTAPVQIVSPLKPIDAGVEASELNWESLFDTFFVNRQRLEENIKSLLREHSQVNLQTVTQTFPLQQGLSELLTYFAIASESNSHQIVKEEVIEILLNLENNRKVHSPQVIFSR